MFKNGRIAAKDRLAEAYEAPHSFAGRSGFARPWTEGPEAGGFSNPGDLHHTSCPPAFGPSRGLHVLGLARWQANFDRFHMQFYSTSTRSSLRMTPVI